MAFSINLSQFAYSRRAPRLRTIACRDKESELEARPQILINATPADGARETGIQTPTEGGCKCNVIPETPSREWPPCSSRTTSNRTEMSRGGRKKRTQRFASSSSEEEKEGRTNDGSRDSVSLFSNTFACKRRKRMFKEKEEDEEEAKREVVKEEEEGVEEEEEEGKSSREGKRDMVSKRPNQPQSWHIECQRAPGKEENQSQDKKGDNPGHIEQNYTDTDSEKEEETVRKNGIRRFFSQTSRAAWRNTGLYRPQQSKYKRTKYPPLVVKPDGGWHSRRGGGSRTVAPGVCEREVGRLRELFPQYDAGYLRERLRDSGNVEETVADILASEGTVDVTKKNGVSKTIHHLSNIRCSDHLPFYTIYNSPF